MHRLIIFYVLCALGSPQCSAQTLPTSLQDRVDAAVLAEIEDQQLAGASIGIIRQGKVAYTQGYGLADRERKTPFTSRTITNWASNSKPIVGIRAMQLVEQGKLKLDDKIRKYLPELPTHCDAVTLRHLLCHQSGYPHYVNGRILKLARPIQGDGGSLNPVLSLNRFGGSRLLRDPGLAYSYSSYGFVIVSAILHRAGKKPLSVQIREGITGPLKMYSFGLDVQYKNQKNWSIGYKRNVLGKVVKVPEYANAWKHGAGGYKSNIEDFANWAAALINGDLVSPKSQATIWTPQKLASGKPTNAGLGFFIDGENRSLKVYHGGSHSEARSRLVIYPNQKHGIVVLCNCGHADPAKISTAIYRVLR